MRRFVIAFAMALAAGFSATPALATKGSFLVVPPGLKPTNVEFFTVGQPPLVLLGQSGIHSDVWGNAFRVGNNSFGFGGPALDGNNHDGVFFPNLTIVNPSDGAVAITEIRWSCGMDAEGDPKLCGDPVEIWEEPGPGDVPTKRRLPTLAMPVFFVLGSPPSDGGFPPHGFPDYVSVPEPSAWAMMIVGFGVTGGMLRRRRFDARRAASNASIAVSRST